MNLKEYRVELGWSVKRMGDEAGISRQAAINAESGHKITAATAKALADALSNGFGRRIMVREIEGLNIV